MGKSQDQNLHIFITHRNGKIYTQEGILLSNQILVVRLLCYCVLEIKVLEKYRPYSALSSEFEKLYEMILNMSLTSMMNLTDTISSK